VSGLVVSFSPEILLVYLYIVDPVGAPFWRLSCWLPELISCQVFGGFGSPVCDLFWSVSGLVVSFLQKFFWCTCTLLILSELHFGACPTGFPN
jgi:hypothetical protein